MTREGLFARTLRFLVYRFDLLALLALLPVVLLSKLYDFVSFSKVCARRNSPEIHLRKVRSVQTQVKKWIRDGRKKRMCTARKAWKSISVHNIQKSKYTQIEIDLNDIVEIDEVNKVVTVEPGVMMGKLTTVLLPMRWTIPIIPEFETLTVGGVICGAGIETSSHKYGLTSEMGLSYEVVLASGEVVNCSKDENSDLFYAIPWSHGTIGFLTAVKIPLLPAKKYVKCEYIPTSSVHEAKELMSNADHDFVEGIMFGPKKIVVMYGDIVNASSSNRMRVNHINRWYKPWFYKHVESFLAKNRNQEHIELIPLQDYYHRHTRAYFWEAATIFPNGSNSLFLALFGWIYPVNFQVIKFWIPLKIWDIFVVTNHVLQDVLVPMRTLEESLEFFHELVEVYPIWLCPCKFFNHPGMVHSPCSDDELYIDIGIYGTTPKTEEFEPETSIGEIEKFVIRNKGIQALYADSYLTRDEFRKMFDLSLYDQVREKYDCNAAFPDVYDKVSRQARRIE